MLITPKSSAPWKGWKGINTSTGGTFANPGYYTIKPVTVSPTSRTGYADTCYQQVGSWLTTALMTTWLGYKFDHIRLITNLTPVYKAQELGLTALRDAMIGDIITYGIRPALNVGLAVNLDAHVSPSDAGGYTNINILTGLSLTGAKYQVMKTVHVAIILAMKAARLPYDMVAFEIMNEPPFDAQLPGVNAFWNQTALPDMENALHTADPNRVLILDPTENASVDGLCGSTLNPESSGLVGVPGANKFLAPRACLVVFHFYEYYGATMGGTGYASPGNAAGGNYSWWVTNADWRDVERNGVFNATGMNNVIAASTAQVDSDASVSAANKAAWKAGVTALIQNTYQYCGWTYCTADTRGPGKVGRMNYPELWCRANGFDNSQIYMGEAGCSVYQSGAGYYPTFGAVPAGRDAWLGMVEAQAARKNYRRCYFEADQPYGMTIAPGGVIPASTRAALALN